MRRGSKPLFRLWIATVFVAIVSITTWSGAVFSCEKPVYLTLDTGHMAVAPLMADILKRHSVRVTFFAAQERTQEGDGSLGEQWAPWWRARAGEGHDFASHTWDQVVWRADLPGTPPRF